MQLVIVAMSICQTFANWTRQLNRDQTPVLDDPALLGQLRLKAWTVFVVSSENVICQVSRSSLVPAFVQYFVA